MATVGFKGLRRCVETAERWSDQLKLSDDDTVKVPHFVWSAATSLTNFSLVDSSATDELR